MNIGVMALNVSNVLVKSNLDKEVNSEKVVKLKIKEESEIRNEIRNLEASNENLIAADSDIQNLDKVEEMVKNTKNNILQHSSMALLSQANKNSSNVISLLR